METYTKWLADQKYTAGNEEHKIFNYNKAIQLYSEAIELNKEVSKYYGQRGFARFHQLDFNLGLQDARQAIHLNKSYIDGYLLAFRCSLALGDGQAASEAIETLKGLGGTEKVDLAPEEKQLNKLGQLLVAYNDYNEKKDYDSCLSVMADAITIFPGALNFQLERAECMMWKKIFTEAMNIAQRIIKLDSLNAKAHFTLGLIYFHRGMLDEAMQSLECSLQNDQNYMDAQNLRERIKQIQVHNKQALDFSKVGQYKEARRVYRNILDSYIEDNDELTSKMWFNCALMNSKLHDFIDTIENCDAALQSNPKYYEAFWERAQCQFKLRKYDNCLRGYIHAHNIEMTSELENLFNEALKHSSEGIAICSEIRNILEKRIECAIKSGDYQLALKYLPTLALIDNHNESIKLLKLKCLISNGDLDEAKTLIQDISKADNQFKEEYVILNKQFSTALKVREYFDNKKYMSCLNLSRTLSKTFDMLPLSPTYKLMEAECLYNTCLYEESEVILNEVLQADPFNSKAYYLKGLISFDTGMLDEAAIQFTKCLESNSESKEAKNMLKKTKEIKTKIDLGMRLSQADCYEHANTVFNELLSTLGSNDKKIRTYVLHQQAVCAFTCGNYDICIDKCSQILKNKDSKNGHSRFTSMAQTLLDSARGKCIAKSKIGIKETRIRENEKLKIDEGLKYFNTSNYKKAYECFIEAIGINSYNPQSMHLKLYGSALTEAECSMQIDPNYLKRYLLTAKGCMIMGDIFKTHQTLQRIQKLSRADPEIESVTNDLQALEASVKSASKFFNNMDYRECLVEIETALKIAHASDHFLFIKAECLVWLEKHTEALLLVESLPTQSINYIKGMIFYMKNQFLNASRYLDCFIAKDPEHKSAKRLISNMKLFKTRIGHGNELMKKEKFDDALNIFTETMFVDKKNVVVNSVLHFKCAECNYKLGNLKQCFNECNSALKLDPGFPEAINLREKCKIEIDEIEKKKENAKEAEMHNSNGDDFRIKANWEEAKASYTRAIDLKPNVAIYYGNRAECNYRLGNLKECFKDCDTALQLFPDFQDVITLRDKCETEIEVGKKKIIDQEAATHIRKGDDFQIKANWEEAKASYTRAIDLKPNVAIYYGKRAECNYRLGNLKECLRDCDIALELFPDFEEATTLRDKCKTEIEVEKKKGIYKEAAMHIKNGDDFKKEANWAEAIASYTTAIDLIPKKSSYYFKRAECNYRLGFLKECSSDCDISLILAPKFQEATKLRDQCKTEIDEMVFERKCESILEMYESESMRIMQRFKKQIECCSLMMKNEDQPNQINVY